MQAWGKHALLLQQVAVMARHALQQSSRECREGEDCRLVNTHANYVEFKILFSVWEKKKKKKQKSLETFIKHRV